MTMHWSQYLKIPSLVWLHLDILRDAVRFRPSSDIMPKIMVGERLAEKLILIAGHLTSDACLTSAVMMVLWAAWWFFERFPPIGFLLFGDYIGAAAAILFGLGVARIWAVYRDIGRARRSLSFLGGVLWLFVAGLLWLSGEHTVIVPMVLYLATGDVCRYLTLPKN